MVSSHPRDEELGLKNGPNKRGKKGCAQVPAMVGTFHRNISEDGWTERTFDLFVSSYTATFISDCLEGVD